MTLSKGIRWLELHNIPTNINPLRESKVNVFKEFLENCVPDNLDVFKMSVDKNIKFSLNIYLPHFLHILQNINISVQFSNFTFEDTDLTRLFEEGILKARDLKILDLSGCRNINFSIFETIKSKLEQL